MTSVEPAGGLDPAELGTQVDERGEDRLITLPWHHLHLIHDPAAGVLGDELDRQPTVQQLPELAGEMP